MKQFRYIGKSNLVVNNGDVLEGELTTWSVKKPNSTERENMHYLYVDNADFDGKQIPIHVSLLQEITHIHP